MDLPPLHYAVRWGTLDVVKLLLDSGSVLDVVENYGHTPLYYALASVRRHIAETLLDRGARLDRVQLDPNLQLIPSWCIEFVSRRQSCRNSCRAILELVKRRSKYARGNGRDALGLVARAMWDLRKNEAWNSD